jgi:hypothetical protein
MTLIEKYEQFLEKVSADPFDFRVYQHLKLFENFNQAIAAHMEPWGSNKAGCLVCCWKEGPSMEEYPVIWLDSEGTPDCVFADNTHTFFQLLPYGTGHLYDIIMGCERFVNNPGSFPSPELSFSNSYAQLQQNTKQVMQHYKEIMELEIATDPARLMLSAYREHVAITQKINESKL